LIPFRRIGSDHVRLANQMRSTEVPTAQAAVVYTIGHRDGMSSAIKYSHTSSRVEGNRPEIIITCS
jgi:hypothetical protein